MRISDLSSDVCSSDLLGMKAQGHAPVRVRRVAPSEKDRARLRQGKPAASLSRVPERELVRLRAQLAAGDRKSVVKGNSEAVRVDCGRLRIIQNNNVILRIILHTLLYCRYIIHT